MAGKLTGRTAVVTGGGSGLGAAICERLAGEGARVLVAYRSSREGADRVVEACQRAGGEAEAHQCDVASDEDCRSLVEAAGPQIDVLVNNAGTTRPVRLGDLDGLRDEDFLSLYDVNVVGAFRMVRAAREKLIASHAETGLPAAVLNISSIAGVTGQGSSVAYAASKGALNTMTRSLAIGLAPQIRVNAACPGFIDSDWWQKHADEGRRQKMRGNIEQSVPLRAASTPEDIADACLPFCLPAFRHVTGETLLMDAGLHLGTSG